jgi:hypothetical protein
MALLKGKKVEEKKVEAAKPTTKAAPVVFTYVSNGKKK